MKYQIADQTNGPFGDIYHTLEEAEAALAVEIAEGQAINDQNAADTGTVPADASVFFEVIQLVEKSTVNGQGIDEIAAFLADNHIRGKYMSSQEFRAWAVDAERSHADGNGAQIEIAGCNSVTGNPMTYTLSTDGLDKELVVI